MTQATQERKKSFSSFTYKEAFKKLGVKELQRWAVIDNAGLRVGESATGKGVAIH
jgi:hypothetical protein